MRTLDIAFERSSQTSARTISMPMAGTRGKLVGNAVPRPAECPDAPSMDHAIDAAPMSEMQHLSLAYDATPFGVFPFSSEDHQDLHTPVFFVRASSPRRGRLVSCRFWVWAFLPSDALTAFSAPMRIQRGTTQPGASLRPQRPMRFSAATKPPQARHCVLSGLMRI
ncbi:hypothetical protein GWK47_053820 [Chionoecetes opilio]|uniref:Uncharacterized protein n=1 Tax=Chionoecetes opilio TaxID=41210 RepID=A0A8J4Y7L0_CHIOP|nr:hypothetical protein GWK47_053820 [Chionoecetes opilio]